MNFQVFPSKQQEQALAKVRERGDGIMLSGFCG